MRSFFSKVLLSSWLFLVLLILTATIIFLFSFIIPPEFKILLFIGYFVFALYLSFYISYRLAYGVTEELKSLQEKTKKINAGEFIVNGLNTGIIEINDLSLSIDAMSDRLKIQFQDLNFEKEKFNLVLQNLKEGVFLLDNERKIIFLNSGVPDSLIPKNSQYLKIDMVVRNEIFSNFLMETIDKKSEDKISLESGGKYFSISLYSLNSPDSNKIFIGVILDKTEDRDRQIFREQFFQNASHELKTPITSIKGYAETLDSKLKNENGYEKKFLAAILRNTERLIRIVEDMLTISKLESSNVLFQPERFDLFELFENLGMTVEGFIKIKNQKFEFSVKKKTIVFGDMVLLEHALLNLIQNASIYSSENSKIQLISEIDETNFLITVTDEGLGIDQENIERIFERFYRVDTNRSRKEGGTGLGLSIVKHIVKLHKGEIFVHSIKNQGSKFTLKLPIDKNK
jgi:two-component system, OmpR family, phosphate regulon sensor histidine kinase PhoR